MGYNDLSESTLTLAEKITEKNRICSRLIGIISELTEKEQGFVYQMRDAKFLTVKQLFYLRDISDKY